MPPTNRLCPQCGKTINVLKAPVFAGKNYCTSNCAIDAWKEAKAKGLKRENEAKFAADQFGKGTKD